MWYNKLSKKYEGGIGVYMKKKSKLITVILTLAMLVGMTSGAFAATGADDAAANEAVWDVSKSKTATNLDENFESQVTLSLPAAEEQPVTDVVFVLDRSSSTGAYREEIVKMLVELKEITESSDAVINVGVVNFSSQADTILELTELNGENFEEIEAVVKEANKSGTNIEAGLLAGEEVLKKGNAPQGNKYFIFLSDGINHIWFNNYSDKQLFTSWQEYSVDGSIALFNAVNAYYYSDAEKRAFEDVYGLDPDDECFANQYDVPYETPKEGVNKYFTLADVESGKYLNGTEKAVYKAAHLYADIANKYKCISLYWTTDGYNIANEFMEWTASLGEGYKLNGEEYQDVFNSVKKELIYLIDSGSYVIDEIGNTDDYDFDFIDDASKLKLTVGEENLDVTKIDDSEDAVSAYGFGKTNDGFRFVLKYYRNGLDYQDDKYSECFKWEINAPVKITEPVQLTYSVKLTNPKTEAGTYGTYDADGSKKYDGLYTNNSAVLYPVDTNKQPGASEAFNKPTVSYTVAAADPAPVTPNKTPGGDGPQTSDDFNMLAVCAAALAALLAGTAAVTVRRKRQ